MSELILKKNLLLTRKKAKNTYPTKVRIPVTKSKVSSYTLKENLSPQRNIAKSLNIYCGHC